MAKSKGNFDTFIFGKKKGRTIGNRKKRKVIKRR